MNAIEETTMFKSKDIDGTMIKLSPTRTKIAV
jgi:hypothetical protein